MPGSHWVAVCISDYGYADYFDPYRLPPYMFEIMAFLQRHSTSWIFNRHILQGLTSYVCGYYCCIYATNRARGQSKKSFLNMFLTVRYTCNNKEAVGIFRAQFRDCPACGHLEQQQSCKYRRRYK